MSAALAFDDERRLERSVRVVVEGFRANGHKVVCSRLMHGCWRFKLDDEQWRGATALGRHYFCLYGLVGALSP